MQVSRKSPLTGNINTLEVNITQEQWDEFNSPNRERLVQEIFSDLTPAQREFIITGYTQEDWDTMFGGRDAYEDAGIPVTDDMFPAADISLASKLC